MIPLIPFMAIALSTLNASQSADTSPIVAESTVNAPLQKVWEACTTTAGISGWMAASGAIELKVGGQIRTSYQKESKLDGPDVIVNQILSFDPERMLTFHCTKTPDNFPYKTAIKNAWTVLYFEKVSDNKTKVICRMLGWDDSEESVKLRTFFKMGNQVELQSLATYFTKKG